MKEHRVTFSALFWSRQPIQPLEGQYRDLWRLARAMEDHLGMQLGQWHPPAESQAESRKYSAFNDEGVTEIALQMAHADPDNHSDIRGLGVWNGTDEEGGMAITSMEKPARLPASLDFTASNQEPLKVYKNAIRVLLDILAIWSPIIVRVGPFAYEKLAVFEDRPAVSWMIYLPFKIDWSNAPEAADLIPVFDERKKQKGTIVVSVTDTFDADNKAHVKAANDLEIRLADQDLLPLSMDFLKIR